jgi:glycine cleavage system H protein
MSDEILELMVDEFFFRIPGDLFYSDAGVWVRPEGNAARLGLSDFAQQSNGDVAFVEISPEGTALEPDDEVASVETTRADLTVLSPVTGTIVRVNTILEDEPEQINEDPYGDGWLAIVELTDWDSDRQWLMDADEYLAFVRERAEDEL